MKIFTVSICLVLAFSLKGLGQVAPKNEAVENTSASISRMMVTELGLNEAEFLQIRNLNQERLTKAAEITRKLKDDAPALNASLRDIEEDFETKLFRILTTRQLEAYAEFKMKPEANFLTLVQQVSPDSKRKQNKKRASD
ncbi:hypothetical protein ACFSC6_16980 [Rufibacter sediminis]|uniref:Periplasmic heavy metal sensor n=1 Tax=Rufibacter sediminis TaxID=2762756 RepID=A0ABR6VSC4_9BACT|nr:hypothetical protein [Rufibacter sediminis]MBC3540093.1 hypothetical protein [Rufibacter sediminis]